MEYQDITKTGPVGLKGLNYTGPSQESENYKISGYRGNIGTEFAGSPAITRPQHRSLDDPLAYLGSSKYDDISAGMAGEMNLNESRFENQSTLDAMGNALAKMLGTAASTIISGGALIATGIPTAIEEKRWSGLWDNDVTQALSDFDNYLEENYKIYQSKEQQEAGWLSVPNLTSASFWGDDVIKNAGFMLGAAASGSMFTGGLGMASRALGLVNQTTKASKVATGILGSLFSAAGEGAIEARHLYNDTVELETQRLDDTLNKEAEVALAKYNTNKGTLLRGGDGNYYDPAYLELQNTIEDLNRRREAGRAEIQKAAREAGNLDMALNIPILTLSNLITLGKGFSKSFSNAAKLNETTNKVSGANLISGIKSSKKELTDAYKKFREEGITPVVESTVKEAKLGKLAAALKPIIAEGSEEMNQQWASSFSGYYKAHKEDPNDYWKAQLDPASQQEAISAITAIGKSFGESWGNYDQWEQFFVGGLTGAAGMPMPTKAFNQDKSKKKYDPRRYFSWEGGSFQNVRDFNKKLQEATIANEAMNARYKDPKFWNRMSSLVAHSYYQADMDEAVANNDIKTFKDSEEKQFVQDLNAFIRTGKLNDFITLIDASTQNLSDEDIADIIKKNTAIISKEQDATNQRAALDIEYERLKNEEKKERDAGNISVADRYIRDMLDNRSKHSNVVGEEKSVGLYTDENGNLTKDYSEIRQELQRNGKRLKERIKDYTESIDRINKVTQGKLSADQVGNLAYLDYMSKAARKRANNILDKYTLPNSFVINPVEGETPEVIQQVLKLPEGAVTKNEDNTITVNIGSLSPERKRDLYLDYGLGHDQKSAMKNALNIINQDPNLPINNPVASQDVLDAVKLLLDSRQYISTFEDYMKNPQKIDQKKSEEEKKADKEVKESTIEEKSVSEIVEDIENGDLEFDEDEFDSVADELESISEPTKEKKVKAAQDIVRIKKEVNRAIEENHRDKADDVSRMLEASSKTAESIDDLLDLDIEAFNDPEVLSTTEEEKELLEIINDPETLEEDLKAAQQLFEESRQQRIDEIKGILQEVKEDLKEGRDLLNELPEGKVVKTWGTEETKSKDPVDRVSSVNQANESSTRDIEDSPTPDTSNLSAEQDSQPQNVESISRGYWKLNTSEFPIHRTDGNSPYYTQIKDPKKAAIYKEIYDFLLESGVFSRLKNNEIKVGQRIRFAISKNLTSSLKKVGGEHTVLLIVDENNNILGDLSSPYDISIFDSFPGLKDLYNKAVDYYNKNQSNIEGDLVVLPDTESSISRPYVGRPLYEEKTEERHTLNNIAQGKDFKLGLAMASGDNPRMIMTPNRRKSQGLSNEDLSIMRPQSAIEGQPFLLIETSDPNRRWYPVPITMPLFNSHSEAKLTRIINEYIGRLADIKNFLTREGQTEWANGLRDLLGVGEVFFTVSQIVYGDNTRGYDINIRIKRKKSDTSWETIYRGDAVPASFTDSILESLNRAKVPYQISKKYINSTFKGQDYNSLIGELANTNLVLGALHTVNDFFSINPIKDNKEQRAKPIQNVLKEAEDKVVASREEALDRQREQESSGKPIDIDVVKENLKNNRLFKSPKWQNRLSRLNDNNILALNELTKKAPILKRTLDFLDVKIKSNMSDEELNNLIEEQLKPKNREVDSSALIDREQFSLESELRVIEKLLPQLNQEDRVRIVDSLIKISNGEAWGQFKDGIITLYRSAAKGTAYHEAFHFVFNSLMTNEEIENAYKSAEKQWGRLSPIELEERMAEDFRRYIQNEETFVGRLKNLWSKLKALLNHFNSNWCYLDRVYSDINKGRYINRSINDNSSLPKYMKVPSVADIQRRVDSLVNNSAVNRTIVARNKAWSNLVDYLEEQGIIVKGYRNKYTWTVTSVRSKAEVDAEAIRAYNENKLSYNNLNQERKDYLRERGITITEYNRMTLTEKEILFECMY